MAIKIQPGSAAASTTEGNREWTNPSGVLVPGGNSQCDTRDKNSTSCSLVVSAFNFGTFENTPEITGFEVSIRRRCDSNDGARDATVRLVDLRSSSYIGQNKARPGNWPTSYQTVVYGGKTDLWGLTPEEVAGLLSGRDVIPQFGIGIKAEQSRVRTYIEYATLGIYYRIRQTYQRRNGQWVVVEPNLPGQDLGTIQRRDVRVAGQWVNVFTD